MDLPLWKKKAQEYVQQTSIKEVSYNISQQSFTKKRMFSSIGDICLNAISLGDAFHIFPAAVYTFWAQLSEGR